MTLEATMDVKAPYKVNCFLWLVSHNSCLTQANRYSCKEHINQILNAKSCVELEYNAMAQGVCELLWLQKQLEQLRLSEEG